MRTPSLFIQHQITNLRVLSELLAAHVEGLPMPNAVGAAALLCRESMLTISVLLPKLEATRQALQALDTERPGSHTAAYQPPRQSDGQFPAYQQLEESQLLQRHQRVCENCD